MNRREFLQASAAAALSAIASPGIIAAADPPPATSPTTRPTDPPANRLPRWRGFNLLEMYDPPHVRDFRESDFEMLAGWGFNFVRIPCNYLCWSSQTDWMETRDEPLKNLDKAVALGQAHGIHVNLNLHRLPGYCVNPPTERAELWTDAGAQDAAAHQWGELAKRFKDIPATALSFDLINEPADMHTDLYVKVITRLVHSIRAQSPDRLIIADGLKWGRAPVPELASLNIAQSTRGYTPFQVSHYKAGWMKGSDTWAVPTWPLTFEKTVWDKAKLQQDQQPWLNLQKQGVGIHVGEWGAFNHTPHDVVLAWMKDCLDLWKANNWGWSLWNLHGSFGVLDSNRTDVEYEAYKGHKLDRKMLELLRET
jgi:endoglucanase